MKGSRPLVLYRAAPPVEPAPALDESILRAARESSPSARRQPVTLLALALGAILVTAFVGRWMSPAGTLAAEVNTRDFGLAEGQARLYLLRLNPPAIIGPGSQEGLP